MFWPDHDMSGWGYAGMVIGMVPPPPYSEYQSPEQVLATRFARGEIDSSYKYCRVMAWDFQPFYPSSRQGNAGMKGQFLTGTTA